MNYMLCRNRVRNFEQWKRVFDNHADAHRAATLKLLHLWHEVDNPRHVFFLFEVEDIERARAFLDSPDAIAAATESGLIEGDFHFFAGSHGYDPPQRLENPSPAERSDNSPPPEPAKSSPPGASPTPPEPLKTEEPANNPTPPAAMKGPERAKSAPRQDEPFEGWEPVANWPPAEAAAEAPPEAAHHRRRWERVKY